MLLVQVHYMQHLQICMLQCSAELLLMLYLFCAVLKQKLF